MQRQRIQISLLYFWLRSPDLAVERVRARVASGGHSIPEEVICRRYQRGRQNLLNLYLPLCDEWMILDNSLPKYTLVAEGVLNQPPTVYDHMIKRSGAKSVEEPMSEDDIRARRQTIREGVKEAVTQAIERHRRLGQSIAVWQDGKAVILEADQIPLLQPGSQVDQASSGIEP